MSVGYIKDCNSLDDLIDSIHRDNFREEKTMSKTEINEDNCVLNEIEICSINNSFKDTIAWYEDSTLTETYNKIFLKINKLNDMAKDQNDILRK